MALNQSALLELLKELELTDTTERIRLLTQRALQELINAEATAVIGAAPYERASDRTTQRNGTRPRTLTTTAGDLELKIPKLREGSFFPSLLERRRRVGGRRGVAGPDVRDRGRDAVARRAGAGAPGEHRRGEQR